jgi:hypothetical protein
VSSCIRVDGSGHSTTLTVDGLTVCVRSGRVVVIGRKIYHSPGAEFVVSLEPEWWERLVPARWRRAQRFAPRSLTTELLLPK